MIADVILYSSVGYIVTMFYIKTPKGPFMSLNKTITKRYRHNPLPCVCVYEINPVWRSRVVKFTRSYCSRALR